MNTSSNDIIKFYLQNSLTDNLATDNYKIEELINNIPQEISIQEFDTYPDIQKGGISIDSFMTLLLQTGYLTYTDSSELSDTVSVRIPNFEIQSCFKKNIQSFFNKYNDVWLKYGLDLLEHLLANATNYVSEIINFLLGKFISVRDTGYEAYYHGFLLGILTMVVSFKHVRLSSELEAGDGYTDITMTQRSSNTAIILELKKCENNSKARRTAANDAANQIINKKYAQRFIGDGYTTIYGMGLGFGGKECAIKPLGNLASSTV